MYLDGVLLSLLGCLPREGLLLLLRRAGGFGALYTIKYEVCTWFGE